MGYLKRTITREEYWEGIGEPMPDEEPYVLECALHFIPWFIRLSAGRRSGVSGAEPISDLDIWSWQMNTRQQLEPHEVETLMAMDASYRAAIHDEHENQKRVNSSKTGNR